MPDGCIYVARNNVINPPNLYKIGKTEFTSPERRMNELSNETTNWDGKFEACEDEYQNYPIKFRLKYY
jgi:hypothetical protein